MLADDSPLLSLKIEIILSPPRGRGFVAKEVLVLDCEFFPLGPSQGAIAKK